MICRLFFLLLVFGLPAYHSQNVIRGKITDQTSGEPISFAGILLKGSSCGGLSDVDGNFYLTCKQRPDSIIIQYIGYQRQALAFKNSEDWNIRLLPVKDGFSLDEVVVESGENPAHRIIRAAIKNKKITIVTDSSYVLGANFKNYKTYEGILINFEILEGRYPGQPIVKFIVNVPVLSTNNINLNWIYDKYRFSSNFSSEEIVNDFLKTNKPTSKLLLVEN